MTDSDETRRRTDWLIAAVLAGDIVGTVALATRGDIVSGSWPLQVAEVVLTAFFLLWPIGLLTVGLAPVVRAVRAGGGRRRRR